MWLTSCCAFSTPGSSVYPGPEDGGSSGPVGVLGVTQMAGGDVLWPPLPGVDRCAAAGIEKLLGLLARSQVPGGRCQRGRG